VAELQELKQLYRTPPSILLRAPSPPSPPQMYDIYILKDETLGLHD